MEVIEPSHLPLPSVPVVAAVIQRDNRFLICQRPTHKRHGGRWEFPGGKLEDGETLLEAARRELHEELGLEVTAVGDLLWSKRDPGSCFEIQFVGVETKGEPCALEHAQLAWASATELRHFDLAPSDHAFVCHLVGSLSSSHELAP